MHAGLDFGTSNCSIGIMNNQQPELIPLEEGKTRMPSCLFVEHDVIKPAVISSAAITERVSLLQRELISRRKDDEISDEALISIARKQLKKEARQKAVSTQRAQSILEALQSGGDVIFGAEAELTHISDADSGFYIKSPKSFLGADINKTQRVVFTRIVEKMLAHIKSEAESIKHVELNNIVIGRPVNFHGLLGHDGNRQALQIIDEAAANVGFRQVEFLMEPVAAAYDYERGLDRDQLALILDLGGGTTDCSMIKLGPSYLALQDRQDCILSHTGKRIGGIDLDNKLAFTNLMPHFGKDAVFDNGLPMPSNLFRQAVSVNDVGAQRDFNLPRTGREIDDYCLRSGDLRLARFKRLRDGKFGLRVSRSAEQAKILLSDKESINLHLDYIESGFKVSIKREELKEAILQAGTQPDVIYVTGGTAISPVIQQWINNSFPDMKIVIGDHFGSVTAGLATYAERLFR
jgi:hypothetical chaperone protein